MRHCGPVHASPLDRFVGHAVRYIRDFVRPSKTYRPPTETERAALSELSNALAALECSTEAYALSGCGLELGRKHFPICRQVEEPRRPAWRGANWFLAHLSVLLARAAAAIRFHSPLLYGVGETRTLISKAAGGDLLLEHQEFLRPRVGPAAE
jgi:lysyl-tRNA synthetase class 1